MYNWPTMKHLQAKNNMIIGKYRIIAKSCLDLTIVAMCATIEGNQGIPVSIN